MHADQSALCRFPARNSFGVISSLSRIIRDALASLDLEFKVAEPFVVRAENWQPLHFVCGSNLFMHRIPHLNPAAPNRAAHVERRRARLVVTLNAAALLDAASTALDVKTLAINAAFDLVVVLIFEPDFRSPVDADIVCPEVDFVLLGCSAHTLDRAVDVRAQETFNLGALALRPEQFFAAVAVPVAGGNPVSEPAAVARLMHADQT